MVKQQVNPLSVEPPQVMHEHMLLVASENSMRACSAKHDCSECPNKGLCENSFDLLVELINRDPLPCKVMPLAVFLWQLTGSIVYDPSRNRFVAKKS